MIEALEIERKYDVDGPVELPLDGLPGVTEVDGPHREVLEATYFDTGDLRLIRAGATLRRRTGGADAGWHLKLPAGGPGERVELRLPLGRALAVPRDLADLTQSRSRGEPLVRVATLRTERDRWRLLDGDTVVAEVVSDAVRAEPVDGEPGEWAELEVELVDGRRELLDELEPKLFELGARPASSSSKIGRALGTSGAAPDGPPDGTAGAVVMANLREHVAAIVANDPKVRRDEPKAIHQMRVSARRARSTLQSFREILDRDRTEPLVHELRWLGTVLAGAREAHVQRERLLAGLRALPDEDLVGPAVARVDARLFGEYARATKSAVRQLRGARYLALLDQLQRLLDDPPLAGRAGEPAAKVLPGLVGRAQRRARRAFARYRDRVQPADGARSAGQGAAALHKMRKASKRARYAAEAVAPALGKPARRSAKRLKRVQSLLGDHQDIVVSRKLLRDLTMTAHREGENTFSYGILTGRDDAEAARLRAELPDLWRRADRRKTRRWTGK